MFKNRRELVRLLKGKDSVSPVYIPVVFRIAAKVEQEPLDSFLSSPTKLAYSLRAAHRLFGYDAVFSYFDTSVDEEMQQIISSYASSSDPSKVLGSRRLSIVTEAQRILRPTLHNDAALIGTVTGPLTTLKEILGYDYLRELDGASRSGLLDSVSAVLLQLSRGLCEAGLDALMVVEEDIPLLSSSILADFQQVLAPIWQMGRYYDALTGLFVKIRDATMVNEVFSSGADLVVASGTQDYTAIEEAAKKSDSAYGVCLPSSVFLLERSAIRDAVRKCLDKRVRQGGRVVITTDWEIPYDTPVEAVLEVSNVVRTVYSMRR